MHKLRKAVRGEDYCYVTMRFGGGGFYKKNPLFLKISIIIRFFVFLDLTTTEVLQGESK